MQMGEVRKAGRNVKGRRNSGLGGRGGNAGARFKMEALTALGLLISHRPGHSQAALQRMTTERPGTVQRASLAALKALCWRGA
jgi:hypothetical protein